MASNIQVDENDHLHWATPSRQQPRPAAELSHFGLVPLPGNRTLALLSMVGRDHMPDYWMPRLIAPDGFSAIITYRLAELRRLEGGPPAGGLGAVPVSTARRPTTAATTRARLPRAS